MTNHSVDFSEWQSNPGTQAFANGVAEQAARALKVLIGTARNSTDPKVTKAVQLLDTLTDLHKTLTERPREEENEAEPDRGD